MDDFDRPLNERGRADAPRMGRWLHEKGIGPDRVLCSPSARTRETFALVEKAFLSSSPVEFDDALYLATSETTLKCLAALEEPVETAMLVAHNPGLHDTALQLLTPSERSRSGNMRMAFPTCACAVLSLPIASWREIAWDIGALTSYMVPKALGSVQTI